MAPAPKSTERPSKNAKIDPPQKLSAKRIKGSPRPQAKKSATTPSVSVKGKEKAATKPKPASKKRPTEDEDDVPEVALPSTFKIIAGSYEKLLYGLEGSVTADGQDGGFNFHIKPMFIFPAHVSCIKAVSASPHGGKWLATGSADEIVKVWDLRRRKEIGGLMHHEGSITHLSFPSRSHLLSASEDGTLCLFRARDWAVLRSLKGHKGRVNSVAVHPSGKVALSVGKDNTLRMWDLMRGKGSASTKLGKEGEIVRWSTDGSMFVIQSQSTIDLYTTDMMLLHTITHPSRLHDVKFCKRINGEGEVLLAAAEDKKLSIYDVSTDPDKIPKIIGEMVGHTNRVKAVDTLSIALPVSFSSKPSRTSTTIVSTVSSDGKIHLYDMAALPASTSESVFTVINPVAEYDSKGTRLTCVTLADGEVEGVAGAVKRKREEDDETSKDDEANLDEEEWVPHMEEEIEDEEEDEEEEEGESD